MNLTLLSIVRSWRCPDSRIRPTADILVWISRRNAETEMEIHKIGFPACAP